LPLCAKEKRSHCCRNAKEAPGRCGPNWELSPDTKRGLAVIGLFIYLAGITFLLWARRALGRNWGISTSLQVKLLDDHQLIQSGPYALVRHPMYFGWWVALLGLTLLYPVLAVLLMLIFSIISFLGRARREEATLAERFGDVWFEYKQHTKFLVPFIY